MSFTSIRSLNFCLISPYPLNVAVFGTQEASQQFHDIIFEVIIL